MLKRNPVQIIVRVTKFWRKFFCLVMTVVTFLSPLAPLGLPSVASAATGVPRIINNQGRLMDSSGSLLGGAGTNYCFKFGLYDSTVVGVGSKVWPAAAPSTMTVPVKYGIYSVGVGDTSAGGDTLDYNFQDNNAVYLNVEVATKVGATCAPGDGAEVFENLSPRQRIFASGYAVNAETVGGFTPAQQATGNQIPALSAGNLILAAVNPFINATSSNALTLQGGGSVSGDIRFFNSGNKISSAGNLTLTGAVLASGLSSFTNLLVGGISTTTIQGSTSGTSTIQGFINVLGTNSTSTFSGSIATPFLNLTGTNGTSTAGSGFNIAAGCFSINGACVGGVSSVVGNVDNTLVVNPTGGNVVVGLNVANANVWTGLQRFANSSSTVLSAGSAFFGATATTTIDGAGNVSVAGTLGVTGNTSLANATSSSFAVTSITNTILKTNANGSLIPAIAGTDYLATAITSLGAAGQGLTASSQTLATTTSTTNGFTSSITVTSSGNTHTFTPSITGTLTASGGGTGISNPGAAGILIGSYAGGTYQQIATSSLGIRTSDVIEGTNLYYQDARVNTYIAASTTIPKTFSANVFSGLTTLNGGLTVSSLNGPLQANNGVVSATSSVGVRYGGTGLSSAPNYGQLLVGNASSGYALVATSTLAIALTDTTGVLAVNRGGTNIISPTAAAIVLGDYSGTGYMQVATSSLGLLTTNVAEGSNLYYQNARVLTYLDSFNKGYFYSTTSADYWKSQSNFYSTTSADYWKSTNNFFSTTSTDFWKSQNNFFSTTSTDYFLSQNQGSAFSTSSANYFADASTTIAKTYSNNAFVGSNTFSGNTTLANATATTFYAIISSSTNLFAENGTILRATTTAATSTSFFASILSSFNSIFGSIAATSSATLASTTAFGRFITGNIVATSSATSTFNGPIGIGITNSSYMASIVGSTTAASSATGTAVLSVTNNNATLSSGTNVLRLNIRTPFGTPCVTGTTCPRFIEYVSNMATGSDTGGAGVGSLRLSTAGTGITQTSGAADFAEYMQLNSSASVGDLVSLNSSGQYQKAVLGQSLIGVISDNPAFVGNATIEGQPNAYVVGFAGVILTTVSAENGAIAAGDLIAATTTAGLGVKLSKSGYALGQALESYSGPGIGTIKVLVMPKYVDAAIVLESYGGTAGGQSGYWSLATSTREVTLASSTYSLLVNGRTTLTNASTTNISASYASSTQGFFGALSVGNLSGVLKATAGVVSSALVNLTTDVTGVLPVANGGTNISSPVTAGVLVGNYAGTGYMQVATSSLGLTTSNVAEGSNLYYQNARVLSYVNTFDKGYFYSTTSADYWKSQGNFFSTTSSDFWKTQNNFFSTTSVDAWKLVNNFFSTTSSDYWKTQNNFFSTTSADYYANASTTIPKTYTDNAFVGSNTFTGNTTLAKATTTSLAVTSLVSTLLKTNAGGSLVPAVAGVDYAAANASLFGQAFEVDGSGYLAPTSSITVRLPNGFVSQASSTVGGNLTVTGTITGTNATMTNSTSTNQYSSSLVAGNATTTSLFAIVASSTNAFFTRLVTGNATSTGTFWANNIHATASTTLQNFTAVNATTSNATSSSLYSANLVAGNATTTTFNAATLSATNGTVTNLLGATATITAATTTNLFASNASTSNFSTSNFTLGSVSGFLKATAGIVSSAFVNLASDVTGILQVANGGTGWAAVQAGSLLYGNGSGSLATTTQGTAGQILSFLNGVPTWVASTTFSGGLSYLNGNVTLSSQLGINNASSTALSATDYVAVGRTATTTIRGEANATSTFAGGIQGSAFNLTGSATSTGVNGINIAAGCFSVNGTCVGSSPGTNVVLTAVRTGNATTSWAVPTNLVYAVVELWGAGGGGGGGGSTGVAGNPGGTSVFGGLATSTGGSGGNGGGVATAGGAGGTGSGGSINLSGQAGLGGGASTISGAGGTAPRGGSGGKGIANSVGTGTTGDAYGGGGSGAGNTTALRTGSGGGAGGYSQRVLTAAALVGTTSVQVGVGTGGVAGIGGGTGPSVGGTGGAGGYTIYEYTANNISLGNGTVNTATAGQVAYYNANGTAVSGTSLLYIDTTNARVGIGSTTPTEALSVNGSALLSGSVTATNLTATGTLAVSGLTTLGNASTTNISASYASSTTGFFGNLSVGVLSGVLRATAGVISSSLVNLASDISGILQVANGGTGWSTIAANTIVTGNGSGAVATSTVGNGLSLGGGALTLNLANTNAWTGLQQFLNASSTMFSAYTAYFGGTATTTIDSGGNVVVGGRLNVTGDTTLSTATTTTLLVTSSSTLQNFTSQNATTTNATTTNSYATTASSTNLYTSNFSLSNLSGILKSTNGAVSTATAGTDYAAANTVFGEAWRIVNGYLAPTSTVGVIVSATSTFGNGTQAGGLTIAGGATTTGNLLVQGNATSSSFFAGTASSTNLYASNATISQSTTTSATSTNSFATTASSTNLFAANFSLGSITGFLKATAGVVSNALVNLATDVTGILQVANGGTGWAAIQAGTLVTGNGSGQVATTSIGSSLQIVANSLGLNLSNPNIWTGLQTFTNASTTFISVLSKASFGSTATTTIDAAGNVAVAGNLNVAGITLLGQATTTSLLVTASTTLQNFTSQNSTTTNATTTTIFSTTESSTNLFASNAAFARSTTTNATSTTSFASTASSTNLFATNATSSTLFVSSASTTNLFVVNGTVMRSTTTNATTTSLFATTASSTNLSTSNFTIAAFSGFLKATAGSVSTSLASLTADVTGILQTANGGTGWANIVTGTLLTGNGAGSVSTTTIGSSLQIAGSALSLNLTNTNVWTGLQSFTNASTTLLESVLEFAQTIQSTSTNALVLKTNFASTNGLTLGGTTTPQILAIDTVNTRVRIGTGGASPVLFVLDTKNTANDPTGVDGGQYYNSNTSDYRCFSGTTWRSCGGLAASSTGDVQFKNADGSFTATANFNWSLATNGLTIKGSAGQSGDVFAIASSTGARMFAIDSKGVLELASTSDPAVPTGNQMNLFAKDVAGKALPTFLSPGATTTVLQSSLAFARTASSLPSFGATTTSIGTVPLVVGTISTPALASTNILTSVRRTTFTSAAGAGSFASHRQSQLMAWRGNAAGLGGFMFTTRFGLSTLAAGNRAFMGLADVVTAPVLVDPTTSTTPGKIGMAINANTGNWKMVWNVTGTAPTVSDLGANFPVNTTGLYELAIYSAPNGASIGWRVKNMATGVEIASTTPTTNIPSSTTFLAPLMWDTNNATPASVAFDTTGWYLESDQ